MSELSGNMKVLRKRYGLTQNDLAEKLGVKRPVIGAYEEQRAEPSIELLQKMATLFDTSIDYLVGKKMDGRRIPIVPVRAAAGYLHGYSDPEFIDSLPTMDLSGTDMPLRSDMRVFQISGDSMHPLEDGAYVIAEKLNQLSEIRSGQPHVVITDEGIVYKRVQVEGVFANLISDNKFYAPYSIELRTIREIWKTVATLSKN
ncbi:MAG: helix-turn-helix domain-containing protein [Flavobacteriales bacterium]|jgi:transcriptional regulator with XRE-family HTH domain